MKDFVRGMKALSDPNRVKMVKMLEPKTAGKPTYVASLMVNLRHWLEDEKEVEDLVRRLPLIRREDLCRKGVWFFLPFIYYYIGIHKFLLIFGVKEVRK